MQTFYDATYIARHLGVTKAVVNGWANKPTANFPSPQASIRSGDKARQESPAWTAEQLPLLRQWLASRLGISDPATHWEAIGRGERHPGGHLDQEALFDHEEVRPPRQLPLGEA